MKKIWRRITKEQKKKSIVFSATPSNHFVETKKDTTYEVFNDDEDMNEKIEKLLSDKFNKDTTWKHNIIRAKHLSFYICPFCKNRRNFYNRTEIKYKEQWYFGCRECFMKSIDEITNFNERKY